MKKMFMGLFMALMLIPTFSQGAFWGKSGNWEAFDSGVFIFSNYSDTETIGNTGLDATVDVVKPFLLSVTITQSFPLVTDIPVSIIGNGELNTFNVTGGLVGADYVISFDFSSNPLFPGHGFFVGGLGRLIFGVESSLEMEAFLGGSNVTDTLAVAAIGEATGFIVDMDISGLGTSTIALGTSGGLFTVGNSEFAFFTSTSMIDTIVLGVDTLPLDTISFGVATPEPKIYMIISSTLILTLLFMRMKRANIYTR